MELVNSRSMTNKTTGEAYGIQGSLGGALFANFPDCKDQAEVDALLKSGKFNKTVGTIKSGSNAGQPFVTFRKVIDQAVITELTGILKAGQSMSVIGDQLRTALGITKPVLA